MSNVQRTLVGAGANKDIVRLITITGADESNTVIYDNSTLVNNTAKGTLMKCWISGSDALVSLAWDQTTDSSVLSANPVNSPKFDFKEIGGIPNPNEAGATGDLLVTTVGIAATEVVTIIIWITQN